MSKLTEWFTPTLRKRIYLWLTPVAALVVFYGLMSEQEVALWVGLGGAVLLSGEPYLAAANVPKEDS